VLVSASGADAGQRKAGDLPAGGREATVSVNEYRTVAESLAELARRGFTANFELLDGVFTDMETRRTFAPEELTIVEHHRFEGASDPDDMAIVYVLEARDGTRGALVDAFGTYAKPGLSEFLKKVKIHERA
jgi:hypothetical protein